MTTSTVNPTSAEGSGTAVLLRRSLALILVAGAGLLLLAAHSVRVGEAWVQAGLLRLLGMGGRQVESVVLVADGERFGLAITAGCSVGPLLAVFLLGTAPVVWWRAMPVARVVRALARLGLVLFLANQVRIFVIVLAMRVWGVERGYEVSHVFIGSAITTVGFVLGVVLLVRGLADAEQT